VLAIDTNVLIYAEITASAHHARARALLTRLAEGTSPWAIPWPCVYEFLRVVTHARVYHPPVPMGTALGDLRRILDSPTLVLLQETSSHPDVMTQVLRDSGVSGNLVHDAHIAALCLEHGVQELLTGDRDFARFQSLRIRNPFED
jgi:toxin-antitoxin system PIN domain toxin